MPEKQKPMRLTVDGITAVRGGRIIFANRSFTLSSGQLLAIVGPNGAGKSTLLRIVAGLLAPAGGRVALEPAGEAGMAGVVHYLGHSDGLKAQLTVRDNLEFWRRLWGGDAVLPALEAVDLAHVIDLPAGVLSAGQKRRVALSRLLLHRRPLWLLDEPLTALDERAEGMLGTLLAGHLAAGGMAMVATHRALPVPASASLSLAPESSEDAT